MSGQVRALVNYNGNPTPGAGRRALCFEKDDVIKLLNNDAQWWKGLLNGDEGWFPSQLVQEETREGFVGPMDRETANRRLGNMPNGTFLIRVSENPGRKGGLSLSIRYDNQVHHIRVEKNAEALFYLADTKFFSSLHELMEFYQDNSLADSFPGVDTTLKFPFKSEAGGGANARILGYAEAVYDFEAVAEAEYDYTSQLSLCRGDKVAIVSKTGSDKGWWKGEHCVSGKNGYFPLAYVRELDDELIFSE